MTLREISPPQQEHPVVIPRTQDEDAQLPAYTAVDESVVLVGSVPDQDNDQASTVADGNRSPPMAHQTSNSTSYMTAEEEKAQLRQFEADATREIPSTPFVVSSPTEPGKTGHASESVLSRGLQVPTSSRFVSSGFPYPELLSNYRVTPADWAEFTSQITQAAAMGAGDWTVAIGGAAGTFIVSGLFIGCWGVIPAYFVGRSLHRKRETENLVKARNTGELEAKLLKWNQDFFAPRGVLIRLDFPGESYDMGQMDVHRAPAKRWGGCCGGKETNKRRGGCCGRKNTDPTDLAAELEAMKLDEKRDGKKLAKMERKLEKTKEKMEKKMEKRAKKETQREGKVRNNAIKKGRIVILPLNREGAAAAVTPPLAGAAGPEMVPPVVATAESEAENRREADQYASSVV
ncbi:MAG: hypothetical protein M1823_001339 [Watsoniomyces obsoletus]|nr:MAG: hypothetical protein M1823_001339 [Watsoniomyces obsoletus]